MMHITAFIRSLRNQVKRLGRGTDRRSSIQKIISLGILSERVWAILYRDSFADRMRVAHTLSGAINAHAIRRVSGANRLMEVALADENYAISARSLRGLIVPPAVRSVARFSPMTPDELAVAKRVGLSFYVEMAKVVRQLGNSRVADAIEEISRGERQALRQLLQTHVIRGKVRRVA